MTAPAVPPALPRPTRRRRSGLREPPGEFGIRRLRTTGKGLLRYPGAEALLQKRIGAREVVRHRRLGPVDLHRRAARIRAQFLVRGGGEITAADERLCRVDR